MIACFHMPQFGITVERQRQPEVVWGEPLVLVNDQRRVVTVSDEAAAFGVRPGIAEAGARSLCPGLQVFRYDGPTYRIEAEKIWNVYAIESSVVEPVSPESCYVSLPSDIVVARARFLAIELSNAVRCSFQVGLGRSKFVALQAAQSGRDASMVSVPIGQETALLANVSLREVSRLDAKTYDRLERLGIRTLGDVLRLPARRWPKGLQQVGHRLACLATGEDGDSIKATWPPPSIERSFSFDDEIDQIEHIKAALKVLAMQISAQLVSEPEYCRSLSLRVVHGDGSQIDDCERLAAPTSSAEQLFRAAFRLFQRLPLTQSVQSLHLRAFDLDTAGGLQLSLLNPDDLSERFPHERKSRLDQTIARLRKMYGPAAVFYGDKVIGRGRIGLWTYPLGHFLTEPVTVWTDQQGVPVRFQRKKKQFPDPYQITKVHRRWHERSWVWGTQLETSVYRVFATPGDLAELQRMGMQWQLRGTSD